MHKLNAIKVRNAAHPGGETTRPITIGDGNGLYLQITHKGSKSWIYKYQIKGTPRQMGLGSADADGNGGLSLKEARERATEAHKLKGQGIDPIDARNAAKAQKQLATEQAEGRTFRIAAERYIDTQRAGWRNAKHAAQWLSSLKQHAFPHIGERDVSSISVEDIIAVLKPIWERIPETASRVRQRIEGTLDYAAAPSRRWRSTENPARWKGVLEHELAPTSKVKKVSHYPSLPWQQAPEFWRALQRRDGMAALVTQFVILTACRSGEARQATWNEIDLERAIFTLPGTRTKNRHLHQIALSTAAVEILRSVRPLSSGRPDDLVFPSPVSGDAKPQPLSTMALPQLVRGMSLDNLAPGELPRWRDAENRPVVVHGFRTTFKSWSLSSGYPDHLSEKALAHVEKDKTRAAYAREQLLDERRPMMEAWAEHCFDRASRAR